ncbi:MAG: hypothetical protein RL556_259 [Actinomycetota bacterium]
MARKSDKYGFKFKELATILEGETAKKQKEQLKKSKTGPVKRLISKIISK